MINVVSLVISSFPLNCGRVVLHNRELQVGSHLFILYFYFSLFKAVNPLLLVSQVCFLSCLFTSHWRVSPCLSSPWLCCRLDHQWTLSLSLSYALPEFPEILQSSLMSFVSFLKLSSIMFPNTDFDKCSLLSLGNSYILDSSKFYFAQFVSSFLC